MLPSPAAADVACQWGLNEWTAAEDNVNVHKTDDWGNTFCHPVTVEHKCINSCFVYRGCKPNCCGLRPWGIRHGNT